MFDAREYLRALQPPQFVDLEGTTHTGRVLSVEEVPDLVERMNVYGELRARDEKAAALKEIAEFCGYPYDQVKRLPESGIAELLADFFGSQPRLREIPPGS